MDLSGIAFVANPQKSGAKEVLEMAVKATCNKGIRSEAFPFDTLSTDDLKGFDLLAVIGGDGTILKGARCAALCNLPVLGVNLGRVGFLSELSPEQFPTALDAIIAGDFETEKRMMLRCQVNCDQQQTQVCLNEFLLYRRSFSGIAHIGMQIDGQQAGTVFCDGLIISTPTGSTGYCISSGGPIVAPGLDASIITPICPHSLHVRPIVTSPDALLEFQMLSDGCLYTDGRYALDLNENDRITITKADTYAEFLRLEKQNLYSLLRNKLT